MVQETITSQNTGNSFDNSNQYPRTSAYPSEEFHYNSPDAATDAVNPKSVMFRPPAPASTSTAAPSSSPRPTTSRENPGMVFQEIIIPLHSPNIACSRVESHIQRKSTLLRPLDTKPEQKSTNIWPLYYYANEAVSTEQSSPFSPAQQPPPSLLTLCEITSLPSQTANTLSNIFRILSPPGGNSWEQPYLFCNGNPFPQ